MEWKARKGFDAPNERCSSANRPSLSLVTVYRVPVAVLTTTIEACAIRLLLESTTVPRIGPVAESCAVWQMGTRAMSITMIANTKTKRKTMRRCHKVVLPAD